MSRSRAGSSATLTIVAVSPQRLAPECKTILRRLVAAASLSDLRWPRFAGYRVHCELLRTSGLPSGLHLRRQSTAQALTLIETLKNADAKGLLIAYGTAVAPESRDVRFRADIYGHDASLDRLLAKGYPYSD